MNDNSTRAPDGSAFLTSEELAQWRAFIVRSENVLARVGRDLTAATGLTVPEFQILVRLGEAPGRALEQRELGELLRWSASRLSHQLSRMEHRGYLAREEVGVGRSVRVTLTPVGRDRVDAARAVHAVAVRTHFLDAPEP
jgi:DNA-binding MarR family transcriptional regulator